MRTQQRLYRRISPQQPLLIRGIGCLLEGNDVGTHGIFGEEAALSTYISLEAALRFLRAGLRDHFGREFSFPETHAYIADAIHLGDPLSQYFQDCWENRVMLVHPESRPAPTTIPPLLADHFYETYWSVGHAVSVHLDR